MTTDAGATDTGERIRGQLDRLARAVATATDTDDRPTAHRILRDLEAALAMVEAEQDLPAAPVLARRFARAHRRALQHAERCPALLADRLRSCDVWSPGPVRSGEVTGSATRAG